MSIFLSESDLRRIFPHANEAVMSSVAAEWNDTLAKYGINANKNRLCFFMAETSAETGGWRGMVEGGEFNGDRNLYKGRGLIQLTNRSNYEAVGEKLAQDFPDSGLIFDIANNPHLAAEPKYVLKTAAAYWDLNKLNSICDTGDYLHLSNRINGSKTVPNGWSLRQSELARIEKLVSSTTESPVQPGTATAVLQFGDSGALVTSLQTMLRNAGYDVGAVDGKFGNLTRMALLAFQSDHDLVPTGIADSGTEIALNNPGQRPLPDQRVSATISELINSGSRTALNGRRVNWTGMLATIFGGLGIVNAGVNTNAARPTGAGAQASATPAADTIGPTFQHVREIATNIANNPPNQVGASKNQALQILSSLDTWQQSHKLTDIPAAFQQLHDFLITPVSAQSAKSAQLLVNQLIAVQDQLGAAHATAGAAANAAVSNANTVVGMIPPEALGALTPVLATVANTVLPGFGGALVTLGLGVATQVFGTQVLNARLDDHRTGANINSNR